VYYSTPPSTDTTDPVMNDEVATMVIT